MPRLALLTAALLAVVIVAVQLVPWPLEPRTATATAPPSASPSATAVAPPRPLPEEGYGIAIVSPDSFEVVRESDGVPVAVHRVRFAEVSVDARSIAYSEASRAYGDRGELFVADVADPRTRRKVLEVRDEVIGPVVWSSDGSGLAVAIRSRRVLVGAVSEYTALRTVDLTTGEVRERARVRERDARPLVWDRRTDVLVGVASAGQKGPGAYLLARDGDVRTTELEGALDPGVSISHLIASSDGRYVAATWSRADGSKSVLRVWPSDRIEAATDTPLAPAQGLVGWLPRTSELVVLGAGRLEAWSIDGARRALPVALDPQTAIAFRHDGTAVYSYSVRDQSGGAGSAVRLTTLDGAQRDLPIRVSTAPVLSIRSVHIGR